MRGFVTVATGNDNYYHLAYNLCLSYKKRGKGKYPFCLICDRNNEYTDIFDDVVLVSEYSKSTLDKLLMRYSPYDETIFMDADILIINPIYDLWDIFADCGEVSAFGCKLQLNSKKAGLHMKAVGNTSLVSII